MRFYLFLGVMLFVSPAFAEKIEKAAKEPAKPKTVKEVLQQRDAAEAESQKTLDAANKAHTAAVAEANKAAIKHLDKLARAATAKGDIGDASKVWEEVLKLNPKHKVAKKFFVTIGRWGVVRKRVDGREMATSRKDSRTRWLSNDGKSG